MHVYIWYMRCVGAGAVDYVTVALVSAGGRETLTVGTVSVRFEVNGLRLGFGMM